MKYIKIRKTIESFILAVIIMVGTSSVAFAAEPNSFNTTNLQPLSKESDVTPLLNDNLSAWVEPVEPNGTASDRAYLDSYIGFTKKFEVTLLIPPTDTQMEGYVELVLKKDSTNENIASWTLSYSNQSGSKTFTLPASGYYTLVVYNHSNVTVTALGVWR